MRTGCTNNAIEKRHHELCFFFLFVPYVFYLTGNLGASQDSVCLASASDKHTASVIHLTKVVNNLFLLSLPFGSFKGI